ncbi:MAG TPA: hypothetical protein VI701_04350 [Anaerolineales bacterium]|nr:hypothetical protein [Anaerolineales bacterium]
MTASAPRVTQIRRAIVLLSLAAIALVGIAALKRATPYGLGLTNDSAAYVGGARALLDGQGFTRTNAAGQILPIVHFPPVFSIVIAAASAFGLEMLTVTRALVLVLFGASSLLFAALCFQLTRAWGWALLGAGLFVSSGAMLGVYSFALSEPLYLILTLAAFVCLGEFFHGGRRVWLIVGAGAAGAAVLTRYVGVSLVLAAGMAVGIGSPTRANRKDDLALFSSVALAPWLAWSARNLLTAGTTSNRVLVWHPPDGEWLIAGLASFAAWLIPSIDPARPLEPQGALALLSWVLLAGPAVWLGARLARGVRTPSPREALARMLALFTLVYLVGLIVSISLFDASTPLDVRVLSPIVLADLALAVAGLNQVARSTRPVLRWMAIGAGVAALAFSARHAADEVDRLQLDGQGFASLSWRNSRALEAVRELPIEILLYSNRPAALLLLLDRPSFIAPTPTDPSTLLPRQGYLEDLLQMQRRIYAGEAVLAFFGPSEPDPADRAWIGQLTDGLPIYAEFNDGTLFGKP